MATVIVDVAVVNQGDNTVTVLFGDGTGAFPGSTTFPTNEMLTTGPLLPRLSRPISMAMATRSGGHEFWRQHRYGFSE